MTLFMDSTCGQHYWCQHVFLLSGETKFQLSRDVRQQSQLLLERCVMLGKKPYLNPLKPFLVFIKGGFFFRKYHVFFKTPNLQKKNSKKTTLNWKFKFPANNSKVLLEGNLNFKSRIVFWNLSFWKFGDLKKRITLTEKKTPLSEMSTFILGWSKWFRQL